MTEKMTYEQLDKFIDDHCRDSKGVLISEAMRETIKDFGEHLTPTERFMLGCRMVCMPVRKTEVVNEVRDSGKY